MQRSDTPEQAEFRTEVREWLEAHAEPRKGEGDWSNGPREHTPEAEAAYFERCREWQRTRFDGGFACITWPEKYGGRGGTPVQEIIYGQEEAHFDVTAGFLPASISLVGPALMRHGSVEQCKRYLRPLMRGEETWCQLFSEPDAGSDLAAVRTRAERDGDEFVVNGQKLWTTSAQHCDYGILLARTNAEAPKHAGITFLLVDMKIPGIEVRPLITMKGDRHFNEVFFTDVRVDVANVCGEIDRGWAVAKTTLANESMMIGTGTQTQGTTASLVQYAMDHGRWEDPLVRQRVAEAYVQERLLGFLRDRLQEAVLEGRMPDVDGSVMKILWSESRTLRAEVGLDIQGTDGLLAGDDAFDHAYWQQLVLDRSMGSVGGGTLEVHRNGIGERVLGLAREPRADRDVAFRDLKTSTEG
ncbi:acyl-CoA dehydrogenase family protein [Myxococcota bacterium]|nr:acyl-CoA dehydrogenase family protein [Myxococcota bacterium]